MENEKEKDYDINISGNGHYNVLLNRGTYGFEEVMKTFEDSEEIYIITYSIHKELLERLYKLNGKQKIIIVTNDPSVSIFNKDDKMVVKNDILHRIYEHVISSQKFNVDTATYFNYSNHSKIVMTDKLAYIGSQNFYGATSFETGVILSAPKSLEEIKNKIVDEIVSHSNPYSISRDLYQLSDIIELDKDVQRLFEEPLVEASHDSRENNAYRDFIVIEKKYIKKVYEIVIKTINLLTPVEKIDDLKALLKQSVDELNESFRNYKQFNSQLELLKRCGQTTDVDLIGAALNYITLSNEDFFCLTINNIENAIELLSELSLKVEEFIIFHFRFFETEKPD